MNIFENADPGVRSRTYRLSQLLRLLSHPARLIILRQLSEGESSVSELVNLAGQSQSSVSQHLSRLREANLVATRREAQTIYYRLADDDARALLAALDNLGAAA